MARLSFFGAAGTVTGSKFLLEHNGFRMLVDCGLFQGLKQLRLRNRAAPPFDPSELDLVVLTHAHLDHTGYLPVLGLRGYEGRVLATEATGDLCGVLLPDSGHLQEEDARWANKRHYSKHDPAKPLYTKDDALRCLAMLRPAPFYEPIEVHDDVTLRFYPAGHILGAAMIEARLSGKGGGKTILFSGDLGRCARPILPDPEPLPDCDHLLVESTYGDRDHPEEDPASELAEVVRRTLDKGGVVLIPAFAVGRTQAILYMLNEMMRDGRLDPAIPIYVDSPMAIQAIRIFMRHAEAHDREMRTQVARGEDPLGLGNSRLCSSVEESKALNDVTTGIIVSASGMATGGRILHHLKRRLPDRKTTVLFAGYQAVGTRGRHMQEGAETVRIHGEEVPVRARVEILDGLSAHADRGGIVNWLGKGKKPSSVHLVHGDPDARDGMASYVKEKLGYETHRPDYRDTVTV
ncbi:MAG: MBL fold metallo-hydrolase [Acidobacteria bacterium]|nr:MBL fold metallo-hydrolase [Acidobacteriota bacterium]NIM61389.1 MBL fold metallo-hydrolase [Acidobacteriota bacterium]NIO58073.1 MBL fold metallo-hydrolase [Acidobacteriota bacterium]NIQ29082.1 MBL fold metallo-hydrolase [Acidobacteriota bacterium]NIQ83626.1 MBL fold metallo-hydrolase [Acidobacteriota bacterium]